MAFNAPKGNSGYNKNKPAAPAQSAAPAAEGGDAKKPVGTLYFQKGKDGERQRITGLFRTTSKAGKDYLQGSSDDGFFTVFLND